MRYHYIVPKLPSVEVSLEKQTICWYILKMHALGIWDLSSHRERCFFFCRFGLLLWPSASVAHSMGLLRACILFLGENWYSIRNLLVCTCSHEHNFDCFISLAGLSPWEQTVVVVTHGNSCSALPLLSSSAAAPCRFARRISLRTWFHPSGS